MDPQTRDRIRSLPCWQGTPRLAPLDGGMTNHNFLVQDGAALYVLRLGVDLPQRHTCLVREIAFPQTVRAHNVQRPAFALGGEMELVAARFEQTLRLHPLDETCHRWSRQAQCPSQRFGRRVTPALLAVKQVFECVFHLLAFLCDAIGFVERPQSHTRQEDDDC